MGSYLHCCSNLVKFFSKNIEIGKYSFSRFECNGSHNVRIGKNILISQKNIVYLGITLIRILFS